MLFWALLVGELVGLSLKRGFFEHILGRKAFSKAAALATMAM